MFPFFSRMFPGTNLQDLNLDWIVRRIMELSKGIVAPWINAQNQHWMVYDTAAETFVDSGVSAAGEGTGPQGEPGKSPVIGSNGNWFTWDTTTQAYTDTGTHAEGPVGPTGPEGPRANNSLLINGYFVGGGSQQGGGQLPINQRGQAVYTGANYGIDCWTDLGASGAITLYSDYIGLASDAQMFQYVEASKILSGETYTASVLFDTGLYSITFTAGADASLDCDGVYLRCYANLFNKGFAFGFNSVTANKNLIAVKLELGAEQTLAHQEIGAWVLNEIADYGQELLKCQRYFQVFRTEARRPTYGADCRPVMASDEPTTSTITINGVTYYTLES